MSGWRAADGDIDSSLRRGVKLAFGGGGLAHAVSLDLQAVGIVNEAVENGVGERGIADDFVPLLDRDLAGDQSSRIISWTRARVLSSRE